MEKITFIKNLHFGKDGLYSIDEFGETTKVFVRQGNLESACVVYSLVMMLLLLNFIKVEDLKNPGCRDDDGFVAKLKKQYIDGLKALCKDGYKLPSFARRLAKIGDGIINIEAYTSVKEGKRNVVSSEKLHNIIEDTLEAGNPVQICYYNIELQHGHSVVVIGYSRTSEVLRLYCLDPSAPLPYCSYWNHIIDVNVKDKNHDWSYNAECKIIVDEVLLIS